MNSIINKQDIKKIQDYLYSFDIMYYLIFDISINTGLSVSQIVDLKYNDLFNTNSSVRDFIYNGDIYYINDDIKSKLECLNKMKKYCLNDYIFLNKCKKNKINRSSFYRVLKRCYQDLGLNNYKTGNEVCRKTYAYYFILETHNFEHLKKVFNKNNQDLLKYAEIDILDVREFSI